MVNESQQAASDGERRGASPQGGAPASAGTEPAQPASARSADSTTFASSIARVIGPTPPGLGDTQPAISAASGETSPTTRDLPVSGSVSRETPTSMSTAPGFTISPV